MTPKRVTVIGVILVTSRPVLWQSGNMPTKIRVLATGGTIASTKNPTTGALEPTMKADDLLASAGFSKPQGSVEVSGRDVRSLDSSSITFADLDVLIEAVREEIAAGADGIVLTHGTDSMEDTALALDLVHESVVPVVLTGAQRSFDAEDSDGARNLIDAVKAAAATSNRGRGVLVQFSHQLLRARGLIKRHTRDLVAFAATQDIDSPRPLPVRHHGLADLKVPIIAAWPGSDGDIVDYVVEQGVDGLVIEALGDGNMGNPMGEAVARALDAGIPVVISTRVPYGPVTLAYGGRGGGSTLADAGAIAAGTLKPGQARIALATAIAAEVEPATLL